MNDKPAWSDQEYDEALDGLRGGSHHHIVGRVG